MNKLISTLRLPATPKFVLPIRLYIAGIAVRSNIPADTIEDIKMALAESCSILLGEVSEECDFLIEVFDSENMLRVKITLDTDNIKACTMDEISYSIVMAMADEVELESDNNRCRSIMLGFKL